MADIKRIVLAALVLLCSGVRIDARAADVSVTGGIVHGADQADGSTIFLGIPYAAPPVGELRWQAPAPVVPWEGVRDATQAPAPCLQHDEGWNKADAAKSREDCLYLSVHMPKHAASARLPVMFWIHGGSNMAGSGFGYTDSTIHRHDVVLVSIEYRLGVFGFLASRGLSAESATHTSGNYALLDQIAALRWVHDNIARFGGDPGNVTISGQSAGAYDTGVLMVSPLAKGLFHKAIAESGAIALNANPHNLAQSEAIGDRFATQAGAPEGEGRLNALRAMSADTILRAQDELKRDEGDILPPFGQASVDGHVVPRLPRDIYQALEQAHVPLLIGSNTREFGFPGSTAELRALITVGFGGKGPDLLAAYGFNDLHEPTEDRSLGTIQMQVMSDIAFRCPANQIAELQSKAGQHVWRYQFGLGRPGSGQPAEHSSELKYVFDAPPAKADFAQWPPVQIYWTNFVRTGNPNGTGVPHWPELGKESNYMDFTPQGPKLGKDLRGDICRIMNRPATESHLSSAKTLDALKSANPKDVADSIAAVESKPGAYLPLVLCAVADAKLKTQQAKSAWVWARFCLTRLTVDASYVETLPLANGREISNEMLAELQKNYSTLIMVTFGLPGEVRDRVWRDVEQLERSVPRAYPPNWRTNSSVDAYEVNWARKTVEWSAEAKQAYADLIPKVLPVLEKSDADMADVKAKRFGPAASGSLQ